MRSINKFQPYISAYNTTIIPNIPIVIHAEISNFNRLTRKLRQNIPQEFYTILSNTLNHCSKNIEGAIFGYQTYDEFNFVINGKLNAYNNEIQELVSIACSYLSSWFLKEEFLVIDKFDLIGDPIFSCNVFGLPNSKFVLDYLIWRQHLGIKRNKRTGSATYKIPKLENDLKKKWFLNDDIPLFKENKEIIISILKNGSDIFRPERDLKV
jgi:tRNA(His) 5'-end guanylyltransferase